MARFSVATWACSVFGNFRMTSPSRRWADGDITAPWRRARPRGRGPRRRAGPRAPRWQSWSSAAVRRPGRPRRNSAHPRARPMSGRLGLRLLGEEPAVESGGFLVVTGPVGRLACEHERRRVKVGGQRLGEEALRARLRAARTRARRSRAGRASMPHRSRTAGMVGDWRTRSKRVRASSRLAALPRQLRAHEQHPRPRGGLERAGEELVVEGAGVLGHGLVREPAAHQEPGRKREGAAPDRPPSSWRASSRAAR